MNSYGMKKQKVREERCPVCEQPVTSPESMNCPHCKQALNILLEQEDAQEIEKQRRELVLKLKKQPNNEVAREELAFLLYHQGMRLRYDAPQNSLYFFEEVVKVSPKHYEARLKASWLSIRFSKFKKARDLLMPVVESNDATTLQKQRAHTNLSCSWNWDPKSPSPTEAEIHARAGIALDGVGTSKLWENLATSLRNQHRLEETREALARVIALNPRAYHAIQQQASIDRRLQRERKRRVVRRTISVVTTRAVSACSAMLSLATKKVLRLSGTVRAKSPHVLQEKYDKI